MKKNLKEFHPEGENPHLNPYRAVQGILPTKREIQNWPYDKFMDFLRFVDFWTDGDVIKVTKEKREEMEKLAFETPHHPYQEFLWRIDHFLLNPEATSRKFYYKLAAMIRQVGGYLKANPGMVDEEMKKLIEGNPRLEWILKHFKVVETKIGAEVVMPDTTEEVGFQRGQSPVPKAEVTMMESLMKVASVFDMLASSIKPADIRGMEVKDKIQAMSKLSFIFTQAKSMKPNTAVFKQLNIYRASKEDLEKSLMDFAEETSQPENEG